jgi:hypothetical protein
MDGNIGTLQPVPIMPSYLIRRVVGDVTQAELEAAAGVSRRVRADQFADVEWEHSHVLP